MYSVTTRFRIGIISCLTIRRTDSAKQRHNIFYRAIIISNTWHRIKLDGIRVVVLTLAIVFLKRYITLAVVAVAATTILVV